MNSRFYPRTIGESSTRSEISLEQCLRKTAPRNTTPARLKGAKEGQQILLLIGRKRIEIEHDLSGLRAGTQMGRDCFEKITCSTIMKQEQSLPETPQWCCSKFISGRKPLRNPVRETGAHIVDQQIRK